MPDRNVGAESDKTAEQQVVVELLQQPPLRADPINRMQKCGQNQLLRWNRWQAFQGIQLADGWSEAIKSLTR